MRKRKLLQQKVMGAIMLAVSIIVPIALRGDMTACLFTVPLGLALLFTGEVIV